MALIKSPSVARPVFNLILDLTPSVRAFETTVNASATNHIVTIPAGTIDGDIMIAAIAMDGDAVPNVSMPAGWELLWKQISTSSRARSGVFWKEAASEGSNVTITTTTSEAAVSAVVTVKDTGPPEVWNNQFSVSNSTIHRCPSVIPTTVRSLLLCHCAAGWGDFAYNTPTNGTTELFDLEAGTGSSGQGALMAWQQLNVPGATGNRDFTPTASLHYSCGQLILPAKLITP